MHESAKFKVQLVQCSLHVRSAVHFLPSMILCCSFVWAACFILAHVIRHVYKRAWTSSPSRENLQTAMMPWCLPWCLPCCLPCCHCLLPLFVAIVGWPAVNFLVLSGHLFKMEDLRGDWLKCHAFTSLEKNTELTQETMKHLHVDPCRSRYKKLLL